MRRPRASSADPDAPSGDALLREDPGVRRHLRRASVLAPLVALLAVAQGYGLAALVVAVAQHGTLDQVALAVLTAAAAARGLLGWWLERSGRRAAALAIGRLRGRLVADAATLSAAAPGSLRPGEVAADAVTQLPAIESYVGRFLSQQPVAGATTVIVLIAIAATDLLSAALLAPTVPLLIVFLWLAGSEAKSAADARLASLQLLGAHLLDVLRGLVDLRAFGRADHQRSQVRIAAEAYRVKTMATLRAAFLSGLVLELVAMLGTALVAVFGGVRLATGNGDLAAILPALVLAPELYAPLRRMGAGYHEAADARAALDRLAAVQQAAQAAPAAGLPGGPAAPAPGAGPIELHEVTVSGGERGDRLRDLTLTLEPGSFTALVGESGAGKSTLAQLILGLLAPTSGSVRAGGVDLQTVDLAGWHRRCAWVAQDPVLLPASMRENVRLGAPHAGDQALLTALGEAGLLGLVAALPEGLDTRLGEDGVRLSTGELRRLALARAILSDAELLVLDEPTAQLDALTAERLHHTLQRLRAGRTLLLITHDDELAEQADRVVALQRGALVATRAGRQARPVAVAGGPVAVASSASADAKPCVGTGRCERATCRRDEPGAPALAGAATTPPAGSATVAASPDLLTALRLIAPPRGSRVWRQIGVAVALGAWSAIAAVAVLALSGGLIVQASTMPPVLEMTAVIVLVRMFSLVRAITRYGERLFGHDAALLTLTDVRVRVLDHVSRHVPGVWGDRPTAALDHAVGDVDRSADLLVRVVVPGLSALVAALVAIAVAAAIWPPAAAAIAGGCAVLAVLVVWTGRRAGLEQAGAEPQRALLAREVVTALDAGPELLLSGRTAQQQQRIVDLSALLEAAEARHGARTAAIGGLIGTGAAVLAGLVAALVAGPVGAGDLSAPFAAGLVLGALAVAERLDGLADASLSAPAATAAVGRLAPALRAPSPELTAGDAAPAASPLGVAGPAAPARLVARDVVMVRGRRTILQGASLVVEPGEAVAIVGENGAGKSSLLLACAGLLEPTRGTVTWNGRALAALPEHERARAVALIPSMPHLFGGTLASNLRLAAPDATEAQLTAALEAVGLVGWLRELPSGLATMLGDDGARASGGQRQRIGLARAWLSPAALVLLDEPASHLPEPDALAALAAVIGARPGRSTVLIAHRAAERRLADREVRLQDGLLRSPDVPSPRPAAPLAVVAPAR